MYETLEIPRFVGQTISEAGEVGGEWWDEGSIDFEKMYTLYILEMHIGKKRILHIILVHRPKKFTHVQWAKKKGKM